MAIEDLLAVVPAPKEPLEPGSLSQWDAVCERLGVRLPDDYRDLGIHYGSGTFANGEIRVANPFSDSYSAFVEFRNDMLRRVVERHFDWVPFDVFPTTPGLLAWGCDNSGCTFAFLTDGDPNQWPTVLITECFDSERWDLPVTTFLARALTNDIECITWRPWPPECRTFHRGRSQADVYEDISRQRDDAATPRPRADGRN